MVRSKSKKTALWGWLPLVLVFSGCQESYLLGGGGGAPDRLGDGGAGLPRPEGPRTGDSAGSSPAAESAGTDRGAADSGAADGGAADGAAADGAGPAPCARFLDVPKTSGVVFVTDYGARGDDSKDDTAAFKKAIADNWTYCGGHANNRRFLYIPEGTYIISDTLFWMRWLVFQGAGRDATVIRLKDKAPGYGDPAAAKPVLHCRFKGNTCSPWDGANNSSFGNYIQDLTVDAGSGNPGAIGIRYNNHNEGALRNVRITTSGGGVTGLDMTETEFGPALIENVVIEGFKHGIVTVGSVSHATFADVTLKNQSVVGMRNRMPVAIHGLVSHNSVPALENTDFWLAHLVLVDADLGGGAGSAAISNSAKGSVYLRDVSSSGYKSTLSDGGKAVAGPINEYFTGKVHRAFNTAKDRHLELAVQSPHLTFAEPGAKWRFVDPSAADDTKAIQKAVDSGASTVFLQFGADYRISDTVRIRGKVRRIIGFNATIRAVDSNTWNKNKPMVVVEDGPHPLTVEHLIVSLWPHSDGIPLEVATKRPVHIRSCRMVGRLRDSAAAAGGRIFIDDTLSDLRLSHGSQVWVRHHNVENNPAGKDNGRTYVINSGASLWILGMKTESVARHVVTKAGASTELLGGFFRDHKLEGSPMPPYFTVEDARLSATYLTYDWGGCGHQRGYHAVVTRGGSTQEIRTKDCSAVIGLLSAWQ